MSSTRNGKNTVDLKVDFCSHKAAKWAVEHWYYRPVMPVGKLVKLGVWEDGEFVGTVVFGMSVSNALGARWGLGTFECCELSRVALKPDHKTQVSRILRVALILLRRHCPGIRAVVSFTDSTLHHGGVYKGGGWLYVGRTAPDRQYTDRDGRVWHSREVKASGSTAAFNGQRRIVPRPSECTMVKVPGKHRYVMPLDADTAARIRPFVRPAPNAVEFASEA